MRIEDKAIRGNLYAVLPTLKQSLNGYLSQYDRVYIGATTNVDVRAASHSKDSWAKMVLLHVGPHAGTCKSLETALIKYAQATNFRVEPDNVLSGGEGIHHGRERYWVYVLVERH